MPLIRGFLIATTLFIKGTSLSVIFCSYTLFQLKVQGCLLLPTQLQLVQEKYEFLLFLPYFTLYI